MTLPFVMQGRLVLKPVGCGMCVFSDPPKAWPRSKPTLAFLTAAHRPVCVCVFVCVCVCVYTHVTSKDKGLQKGGENTPDTSLDLFLSHTRAHTRAHTHTHTHTHTHSKRVQTVNLTCQPDLLPLTQTHTHNTFAFSKFQAVVS